MTSLLLGLVIFLGIHSIGIFANDWRTRQRARLGEKAWKLSYTVVSLLGFGLIVWGYGMARQQPVVVWNPPLAMRHIAALLMLLSFILLAAAYIPRNAIKARVHHPMTLAVTVWSVAHLLSNGMLADILLFASFLVWSKVLFIVNRKRDRATGKQYPAGSLSGTAMTVGAGIAGFLLFAFWLHGVLIGVRPFG